jgi:hypothetical protein
MLKMSRSCKPVTLMYLSSFRGVSLHVTVARNASVGSELNLRNLPIFMPAILSAVRYMTLAPEVIQLQVSLTDACG